MSHGTCEQSFCTQGIVANGIQRFTELLSAGFVFSYIDNLIDAYIHILCIHKYQNYSCMTGGLVANGIQRVRGRCDAASQMAAGSSAVFV